MLFYFSATGNTKHVAEKIKEPQEEMISIEEACKAESYEYTVKDGRFGILSPTYAWGLPSIVYEFLEKLKLRYETKPYSFYVGTFWMTTGAASSIADSLLKEKCLALDAKFDIRMPDTWTVIFDLSNAEKVKTSLKQAEEEINELKVLLSEKKKGKEMDFTVPETCHILRERQGDQRPWTIYVSKIRRREEHVSASLCFEKNFLLSKRISHTGTVRRLLFPKA